MDKISLFIAKERINKKMSKKELAKKTGCTERAIEYWESGKRNISLYYLDKLLKALELSMKIGVDGEFE